MRILTRRAAIGGSALLVPGVAIARKPILHPAKTVLVEQTYLKALPDLRADLTRYIVANWFAMDQRGFDAGIFTSFALYEETEENKDWDLVMAVGYPQALGYDDPTATSIFKEIRRTHKEVLINGRALKELGSIVRHHKLKIVAA
jgi:hypothetical protein